MFGIPNCGSGSGPHRLNAEVSRVVSVNKAFVCCQLVGVVGTSGISAVNEEYLMVDPIDAMNEENHFRQTFQLRPNFTYV